MSVGAVNKQTGDRIPTAGMPAIDSVLSGSSTNPVQNRVVKAAMDEKADTDIVASDFSAATSYTAGEYCIYGGKFYKFKNNHSGAWAAADVDEIKIAGELSALKSGLTSQLEINVTLPATTDGRSSVQLPDAIIPTGAKVVGCVIANVSTYSDGVTISAYFLGRTIRVTMVSNMNDIPQITLKLIVGITY